MRKGDRLMRQKFKVLAFAANDIIVVLFKTFDYFSKCHTL